MPYLFLVNFLQVQVVRALATKSRFSSLDLPMEHFSMMQSMRSLHAMEQRSFKQLIALLSLVTILAALPPTCLSVCAT